MAAFVINIIRRMVSDGCMRGQAALEYLTTYGWAFMVVLVMVGALAYFGLTDAESFIPERCDISIGFACEDYQLLYTFDGSVNPGSEVSFIIKNAMKETIYLNRTYITYNGYTPADVGNEVFCGVYRFDADMSVQYDGDGGIPGSTDWPSLDPGQKVNVLCNYGDGAYIEFPVVGEKERVTFEFTYKRSPDGFPHRVQGEIVATVQAP